MKNIYYLATLTTLTLTISAADVTPATKRIRIEEQHAKIVPTKSIPTLTEICLSKVYPYLELERLVPEILETFDLQLTLEIGFNTLTLEQQTQIINRLLYQKNLANAQELNIAVTPHQLIIDGNGVSYQIPQLKDFYKKIMRRLLLKNRNFKEFIFSFKDLLIESTVEKVEKNLQLLSSLPTYMQEYIQQLVLLSQRPAKLVFTKKSAVKLDVENGYIILKRIDDDKATIVDENLTPLTVLPIWQNFTIVDDIIFFHENNSISVYDLKNKIQLEHLQHDHPVDDTFFVGQFLYSTTQSQDNSFTLWCWNLKTRTCVKKMRFTKRIVHVGCENNLINIVTVDGKILSHSIAANQLQRLSILDENIIEMLDEEVPLCRLFNYKNRLYVNIENHLLIFDLSTEALRHTISKNSQLKYLQKNNILYLVCANNFSVWDMDTESFIYEKTFPENTVIHNFSTDDYCIYLNTTTSLINGLFKKTTILDIHDFSELKTHEYTCMPYPLIDRNQKYFTHMGTTLEVFYNADPNALNENNGINCLTTYVIEPFTGTLVWQCDDHENTLVDFVQFNNSFYTSDLHGRVVKRHLPLTSWKLVIYQKLLEQVTTQDELKKADIRLTHSNFVRTMSPDEKVESLRIFEEKKAAILVNLKMRS